MVTTPINIDEVLNALERWISQRPGLDWRNYGTDANGRSAYRAELRTIAKDKARAVAALDEARAISWVPGPRTVDRSECRCNSDIPHCTCHDNSAWWWNQFTGNHSYPRGCSSCGCKWAEAIPDPRPAILADAFRAFSGRLSWGDTDVNGDKCTAEPRLSYCTGQYWPTEYRKAAAAVLEAYISGWRQHEAARNPKAFTYTTLDDVKAANRSIGHHWFDPSTMRFFRTKLESGLIAGRRFITSEQDSHDERRRFTIREAQPDGTINTVGEFQQFASKAEARAHALASHDALKGGAA